MNDYLATVIEDKGVKDLRDTREQVSKLRCVTVLLLMLLMLLVVVRLRMRFFVPRMWLL